MASEHDKEVTYLRDEFRNGWNATLYPLEWDNGPAASADPEDYAGWVRWTLIPGGARRQDLGETHGVENAGLVIVQVFTRARSGLSLNNQLCDEVDEIYFGFKQADGSFVVRTRDASRERVGTDGAWFQQNVVIPYVRESIRSN